MVQEVQDQHDAYYNAAEFEHGDFVARGRHTGQAAGGALEGRREGGECLALHVVSAFSLLEIVLVAGE
jgi:hypothetical protein